MANVESPSTLTHTTSATFADSQNRDENHERESRSSRIYSWRLLLSLPRSHSRAIRMMSYGLRDASGKTRNTEPKIYSIYTYIYIFFNYDSIFLTGSFPFATGLRYSDRFTVILSFRFYFERIFSYIIIINTLSCIYIRNSLIFLFNLIGGFVFLLADYS